MNYNSNTNKFTKVKKFKTKLKCFLAKLLHTVGYSVTDIAEVLKVSNSRVYQYLKK